MPKIMKIVINPQASLREPSKPLNLDAIKSKQTVSFVKDMMLTMKKKDGVGLAAPQVGKNLRLVIVNTKDGPLAAFNPKIIKKSLAKEIGEEGCLSVPGYYGEVKRHTVITVQYLNREGKEECLEAEGMLARVFQHEIDHLDGILFIDKAKNIKRAEQT